MKIKLGKLYVNKTWRFLIPCLKAYGDEFTSRFNKVFKMAVGIHDSLLDAAPYISECRNIYILLDKSYKPEFYIDFFNFLQDKEYFKADYCFESNILNSKLHMIIIEIPKQYNNAYDSFLKSEYSKMFTLEKIKLLFSSEKQREEYEILTKTGEALIDFVAKVSKEFDVKVKAVDYKEAEWELPLKKQEEIFNCNDIQRVFFNVTLDKIWFNEKNKTITNIKNTKLVQRKTS